MLDITEATKIISKSIPNAKIQAVVEYGDLYLFQVFTDLPFEEELDPFFSVNKETGEFRDFSILTDGNVRDIEALFMDAKHIPRR
jgi:hypothetical protein